MRPVIASLFTVWILLAGGCKKQPAPNEQAAQQAAKPAPPASTSRMEQPPPAAVSSAPVPRRAESIAAETPIEARTTTRLSTETNKVGDTFTGTRSEERRVGKECRL